MTLADWLWAIPVFGLMIFVHELGHFGAARLFGIRVEEFALGFGPSLFGCTRGDTRYSLRAVPLGGYVRMAGMDPWEPEEPDGFNSKPLYARALTMFAGPFMNLVLASLLLSTFVYVQGWPVAEPIVGQVVADCGGRPCPAAAAGLQPGDRILEIDGRPVRTWEDIPAQVAASGGGPVQLRLQRDGRGFTTVLTPVAVDGGYVLGIQQATLSFWQALALGPALTYENARNWVALLLDALTGWYEAPLTGPVGMTRAIAAQASAGLTNLLWVTALLSLNLGLFNLLPIPALDGAHLLFMAVEAIRGRRLNPEYVSMAHFVGFLLLMGLILAVTYSDLRAAILGALG